MMNPIKYFRLRCDWRLVSTLQGFIKYTDSNRKDDIFYYLLENGLGARKCKHDGTGIASGRDNYSKNKRTSHPYYLAKIRPWLEGGYDPEIPSYETIKQKEFKDALKGKKT